MPQYIFMCEIVIHNHMGNARIRPVLDPCGSVRTRPLDPDFPTDSHVIIGKKVLRQSADAFGIEVVPLTESKTVKDAKGFPYQLDRWCTLPIAGLGFGLCGLLEVHGSNDRFAFVCNWCSRLKSFQFRPYSWWNV